MAGVCKGECLGHNQGNENLTLMRYFSCGMSSSMKPIGVEVCLRPRLQLKGIKGKFSF